MARATLNDLAAFVACAEARSFTRAAERLGISASALSHAMRGLEERLGVRLLARTTRSVAVTDAGERLLLTLRPAMADIDAAIEEVSAAQGRPAGVVRLTAVRHAVSTVLMPLLPAFAERFPGIRVEVDVDDGMADIVARGYDAGIRFEGGVDQDMIALRVGPELRAALVGSPSYLAGREPPRSLADLGRHRLVTHRRPDGQGTYPWPFEEEGRVVRLRPEGAYAFSDSDLVLDAALAGLGLAYVFEDRAAPALASGGLVRLLEPLSARIGSYALYHPSRHQTPPALAALISALRAARPAS